MQRRRHRRHERPRPHRRLPPRERAGRCRTTPLGCFAFRAGGQRSPKIPLCTIRCFHRAWTSVHKRGENGPRWQERPRFTRPDGQSFSSSSPLPAVLRVVGRRAMPRDKDACILERQTLLVLLLLLPLRVSLSFQTAVRGEGSTARIAAATKPPLPVVTRRPF